MMTRNRKLPTNPCFQATALIEKSDFQDHDVVQKIFWEIFKKQIFFKISFHSQYTIPAQLQQTTLHDYYNILSLLVLMYFCADFTDLGKNAKTVQLIILCLSTVN